MKEQHLLIPKIENGIVIDHIPVGFGAKFLDILHSHSEISHAVLSAGFNYASTRMGKKDIIKLGVESLPQRILHHFSLICSGVSIKRIRNYAVEHKYVLEPAPELEGFVVCRNPNCITNNAKHVTTRFNRVNDGELNFRCCFCEKVFPITQLSMNVQSDD